MGGGCQCHTWLADAAFDGVNAVARLTELCCGPCRYCPQSRAAPVAAAAGAGSAATAGADSTRLAIPNTKKTARTLTKGSNMNIAHPLVLRPRQCLSIRSGRQAALPSYG